MSYIVEFKSRVEGCWYPSCLLKGYNTFSEAAKAAIELSNYGYPEYRVTPTNGGDSVPVPSVLQDTPKPAKSPVEKSILGTTEFFGATVVVIDGDKLEREVLKASIADGDVQKLLPFQTKLVVGKNHIHIENASAYTAETNYHSVAYGDTICARQGQTYAAVVAKVATCPGCLAKAKGLIVNHLLNTPGIIR